jgi:fatty acid desaturase
MDRAAPNVSRDHEQIPMRMWLSSSAQAVGTLIILFSCFLTWTYTGRRGRNAFDVVSLAQRFNVVPNRTLEIAAKAFFLLPAVSALLLIVLVLQWRRLAVVLAAIELAGVTTLAVQVLRTPFRTGVGPTVALIGAAITIVGVVTSVFRPVTRVSGSGEAQLSQYSSSSVDNEVAANRERAL